MLLHQKQERKKMKKNRPPKKKKKAKKEKGETFCGDNFTMYMYIKSTVHTPFMYATK